MNIQARIHPDGKWESYGIATHVKAAELHARRYPFSFSAVETRMQGREPILRHQVLNVITYDVKPDRND